LRKRAGGHQQDCNEPQGRLQKGRQPEGRQQ